MEQVTLRFLVVFQELELEPGELVLPLLHLLSYLFDGEASSLLNTGDELLLLPDLSHCLARISPCGFLLASPALCLLLIEVALLTGLLGYARSAPCTGVLTFDLLGGFTWALCDHPRAWSC